MSFTRTLLAISLLCLVAAGCGSSSGSKHETSTAPAHDPAGVAPATLVVHPIEVVDDGLDVGEGTVKVDVTRPATLKRSDDTRVPLEPGPRTLAFAFDVGANVPLLVCSVSATVKAGDELEVTPKVGFTGCTIEGDVSPVTPVPTGSRCDTHAPQDVRPATSADLANTSWRFATKGGCAVDGNAGVNFTSTRWSGDFDCNSTSGTWRFTAGALQLDVESSTKVGCGPGAENIDVNEVRHAGIDSDDQLVLMDAHRGVLATAKPKA